MTELKLDSATITTGLLHDTIEDTNVTYETVKKNLEKSTNLVRVLQKFQPWKIKHLVTLKQKILEIILATSKDIGFVNKLADDFITCELSNLLKIKTRL